MIRFISTNFEAIIAILAFLISLTALFTQRKHNRLTFKPIPYLLPKNYEDYFAIMILNQGTGPMTIKSFKAKKDDKLYDNLIDIAPTRKELHFETYLQHVKGRSITPNNDLILIGFRLRRYGEDGLRYIQQLREVYNNVEIVMEVYDIYGKSFVYNKKLQYRLKRHKK